MVAKCWRKLCQKGTLYWRKLWNQAVEKRTYFQELGERATLEPRTPSCCIVSPALSNDETKHHASW